MQFHINYHYIHIRTYLNITSYTYKIHIYMCMCIYTARSYIYNHTAMLQARIDVWIIHDYPTTYAKIATSES